MLLMCISVLCVLLYAQIKGEFSQYLVGLMISFKFMLCSLTHWRKDNFKEGWMVLMESLGTPKVVSNAPILSGNGFE